MEAPPERGIVTEYRCASGKRCVNRTTDGASPTSRPVTLCHGCITDVQKQLDELPGYVGLLMLFKGVQGGAVGQSRVSKSSEPSSPLNMNVVDLIDDINSLLMVIDGDKIRDLITFDGGIEIALRVRKAHSKADGIVGLGRVWERRRVPCPSCSLPTLGGWLGEGTVYCTNSDCGDTMTKTEYEAYCEAKSKARQ